MALEIDTKSCKSYSYHNYLVDFVRQELGRGSWGTFSKSANLYMIHANYPKHKTTVIDMSAGGYAEYVD
ncbi:MAG: hypothetical protein LBP63_09875 [Prevotellaceae bacterium]|jgi:hypothetical protein|nr:hypothetical protein [Prevotellaceae bacterium]